MNVYLSIDGVILVNSAKTADYASEFILEMSKRFPDRVYLLKHKASPKILTENLMSRLKPPAKKALKDFKIAEWKNLKTDAINFMQPFIWFDTDILPDEKTVLDNLSYQEYFRQIDLDKDHLQLLDEISYLRSLA